MKKFISLMFSIFLLSTFLHTLHAQSKYSLGANIVYDFNSENVGLQIRGTSDLPCSFRVALDGIHYFKKENLLTSSSTTSFNANLLVPVLETDICSIYPFAGWNLTRPKTFTTVGNNTYSSTTIILGWNVGANISVDIGEQFTFVGETKYVIGDAKKLVIGVGVEYQFGD